MELHQAMLMKVLLVVPESEWRNLWFSGLYRSHTIICDGEMSEFWYILMASPKALLLMRLNEVPGEQVLEMDFSSGNFVVTAPANFNSFLCCEVDMSFEAEDSRPKIFYHYWGYRTFDVFEFAVRNYFTSLNITTLKSLAKDFSLKLEPKLPHIDVAEALLNFRGISGDVKDAALEAVRELMRIPERGSIVNHLASQALF